MKMSRRPSPQVAHKMSCAIDPSNLRRQSYETKQRLQSSTRQRIRTSESRRKMASRTLPITLAMGLFLCFLSILQCTAASSAAVSATPSVVSSTRSMENGSNYTSTYQHQPRQKSKSNVADSAEPLKKTKKRKRRRKKKQLLSATTAVTTPEEVSLATDLLLAKPRVAVAAAAVEQPSIHIPATCLANNSTTMTTANNTSVHTSKSVKSTHAKKHKKKKKRRKRKVPLDSGSSSVEAVAPNGSSVVTAAAANEASSIDVDVPAATTVAVEPLKPVTRSKTSKPTKPKATKPKPRKSAATTAAPLSREAASSLRRIQGEWKDAVQAGIAFDWKKGKPVRRRSQRQRHDATDNDTTDQQQHVWLGPLSQNIWIWHFSVTGVPGSVYGDGIYHGRIVLPSNYPAQPPRIQVWTPSGRFLCRTDICLSASSYHPESWSASWSIRTIVEALRLHMMTPAQEIGGLNDSYEKRLSHVTASRFWRCHISPSVVVDHAHMVAQNLFPEAAAVAGANEHDSESLSEPQQQEVGILAAAIDEETNAKAKANVAELATKKSQQNRRQQQQQPGSASPATRIPGKLQAETTTTLPATPSLLSTLQQILGSPVRLTLLGFAILFFVLNRP